MDQGRFEKRFDLSGAPGARVSIDHSGRYPRAILSVDGSDALVSVSIHVKRVDLVALRDGIDELLALPSMQEPAQS